MLSGGPKVCHLFFSISRPKVQVVQGWPFLRKAACGMQVVYGVLFRLDWLKIDELYWFGLGLFQWAIYLTEGLSIYLWQVVFRPGSSFVGLAECRRLINDLLSCKVHPL